MASNKKEKTQKKSGFGKWIKRLFILGMIGVLLFAILFLSVLFGAFGELPSEYDLKRKKVPVASEIYANDGSLLGKFYTENRSNVKYEQISKHIVNGLVATEDKRFFDHKGFDAISYMRVVVKNLIFQNRKAGGGSTISQQVIKNLYKRQNYSLLTLPVNKIKEAIVATRLERVYDKKDIITLYLNTVPFGELAFGIGTASQRFFNKKPMELNIEESATLVGMLKATTRYSPRVNPTRSKERRNVVIDLMQQEKYISNYAAKEAKAKPLTLDYNRTKQGKGLAPHFRLVLRKELKKWADENPMTNGNKFNIFTDGLKIYTTIDPHLQKYAMESVKTHMPVHSKKMVADWPDRSAFIREHWDAIESAWKKSARYKKLKAKGKTFSQIEKSFLAKSKTSVFTWDGVQDLVMSPQDSIIHHLQLLNTGFVAMDPETGEVKAWVGGIDTNTFPEDHVTTPRQVGSTFKPFTYATALIQGTSPCKYYPNELRRYTEWQDWTPKNAGNDPYGGYYSLQGALANSVNTVAAQVIFEAGIGNVIHQAKKMGIKSDLPEVPSITLGTADISPLEMVTAYCAFANGGYATEPFYIKKIADKRGKTIKQWRPKSKSSREKVLDDLTVQTMQTIMQKVVTEGTAQRLRWAYNLNNEIAGKTGTTQDQGDGWFIGYTPGIVAGAWVGSEDRRVHFRTLTNGQGSRAALPIFGGFMKRAVADSRFVNKLTQPFPIPEYLRQTRFNCELFSEYLPQDPIIPGRGGTAGNTTGGRGGTTTTGGLPTKPAGGISMPGRSGTKTKPIATNTKKVPSSAPKKDNFINKWFKNYKDNRKEKKAGKKKKKKR